MGGDFDPMSQRAVKSFQTRNTLARNGLTQGTLDALDLLEIIPNYELN